MAVEFNPSISQTISNRLISSSEQISSGKRINSASDDVAGFGVSVKINTQIRSQNTAVTNAISGISLLQTADAGLQQLGDGLQRLRELTIQSGNSILNSSDRQSLQQQADQILLQIQESINSTSFNGLRPLAQQGSTDLQIGSQAGDNVSVPSFNLNQRLDDFGLNSFDLTDPTHFESSLSALDQSLSVIDSAAAEFGASRNRLDSVINNLQISNEQQAKSASAIEDSDVAKAISELIHNRLLQQSIIALQAQANSQRGDVLALLSG
ncbi:flagellin [Motiliproteus sp. MSK22-1]|uniref:flagellin n=1 Tax=Motiliproteus sp. MSK22-1 TaxID=1897630 RepID=UPI0009785FAF|nr:flagellin [Motiliproteus sp. MSK22-1]OMH38278.1 hypothetical protein BGP75_08520 [Motiliproteus sp. MSK22-1]